MQRKLGSSQGPHLQKGSYATGEMLLASFLSPLSPSTNTYINGEAENFMITEYDEGMQALSPSDILEDKNQEWFPLTFFLKHFNQLVTYIYLPFSNASESISNHFLKFWTIYK